MPVLDGPQHNTNSLSQLCLDNAVADFNSKLRVNLPLEQALFLTQQEMSLLMNEVRSALLENTISTR